MKGTHYSDLTTPIEWCFTELNDDDPVTLLTLGDRHVQQMCLVKSINTRKH